MLTEMKIIDIIAKIRDSYEKIFIHNTLFFICDADDLCREYGLDEVDMIKHVIENHLDLIKAKANKTH